MNAPQPNGTSQTAVYERVARLEASVEHLIEDVRELRREVLRIRTVDFRILYGTIIVSTLGTMSIVAKVFDWI